MNEFSIGIVMALNGLLIALVEMVIVFKLEGRKPYLLLMSYGAILMAIAFLVLNLPVFNGFGLAVIFILIVTAAEMIAMPFMNSFYIGRSTAANRGQYAALYVMAWSAAQVIGSSTGTQIVEATGFFNLWFIVAALGIIGSLGYRLLHKKNSLNKMAIGR